jgi:hypothetical protein
MHPYILGIFWALGRYVDETESPNHQYFFLRHNQEHFLQVVRQELKLQANVHIVTHHEKPEYRLKISGVDVTELVKLGWSPRWAEQRDYPRIAEHRDFIRAYTEIHSSLDIIVIRERNRARTQPRLRIYGNRHFLEQLTEVLFFEVGSGVKKVQKATNQSEPSGILYYQSRLELERLLEYLYSPSTQYFSRDYYERFREILRDERWTPWPGGGHQRRHPARGRKETV